MQPCDFLDQIDLARKVGAVIWRIDLDLGVRPDRSARS
jgi:hypothetical protein